MVDAPSGTKHHDEAAAELLLNPGDRPSGRTRTSSGTTNRRYECADTPLYAHAFHRSTSGQGNRRAGRPAIPTEPRPTARYRFTEHVAGKPVIPDGTGQTRAGVVPGRAFRRGQAWTP